MADNYLEKRYDEVFGNTASRGTKLPSRPSLDTLLLRNRSIRGYDKSYKVHRRQLDAMIAVNTKIASSVNMQMLRFHPVTADDPAVPAIQAHIRMGRGLPELHLPFPGTEPEAFIIVYTTVPENSSVDIDLGISLQSMLLKAVELGLNGLIIRNFDHAEIKEAIGVDLEPVAVVALGRSAEKVELVELPAGSAEGGASLKYYREDGVHYVPKLCAQDLTV